MWQLLQAVNEMHSKMLLHRDLKPDNILISNEGVLKVADLGLSRKNTFHCRRKSNTIVSLWYRAPEIILGSEKYLLGVDMWSVGCIFAEMLTDGIPLFQDMNEDQVLAKIIGLLGVPKEGAREEWTHLKFIEKLHSKQFEYEHKHSGVMPFASYFSHLHPVAFDLLKKLLCLDPAARINAKEALSHPFFAMGRTPKIFNHQHIESQGIHIFEEEKKAPSIEVLKKKAEIFQSKVKA